MACAFLFVMSALVGMACRDAAAAARLSDDDRAAEPLAGWRVMATRLVDAGELQSVQWSLQTRDGSVVLGDVAFGTDG
jgi:hypothetical protein